MLEYCDVRMVHRVTSGLPWRELVQGSWKVIAGDQHAYLVYQGRLYYRGQMGKVSRAAQYLPVVAVSQGPYVIVNGVHPVVRVLCADGVQYEATSNIPARKQWSWHYFRYPVPARDQLRVCPLGPYFTAHYWKSEAVRWLQKYRRRALEHTLIVQSSYWWYNTWLLVGMSGQIYSFVACECKNRDGIMKHCPWHQSPPEPLFPLDEDRVELLQRVLQESDDPYPTSVGNLTIRWERGKGKSP